MDNNTLWLAATIGLVIGIAAAVGALVIEIADPNKLNALQTLLIAVVVIGVAVAAGSIAIVWIRNKMG